MTSVFTAARAVNGPRAAAHVEPGAGAVRVALLLAEVHVQARVEQAAEDRAHDRHRVEVGVRPRQARVPDRISVWTAPGRWTTCTKRAGRRPEVSSIGRAPADGSRGPVAEQGLDDREHLVRGRGRRATTIARAAGSNARSWTARSSAAVERRDGLRGAAGRPVVRGATARRSSATYASSARRRGSAFAWSRSVSRSSRSRSTSAAGNDGPAHDLGEELQRGREAARRARRARRTSRPSRPRRGSTRRAARRPR